VAAGAAVFTLAGAYGFSDIHRGPNVDPMRVAAQIASGIGFIGAGAIIRDRGSVRGITTAAALWASAAVGLSTGAGLWWVAAAGAAVILLVLVGLRPLGARIAAPVRTLDIEYEKGHGTLGPVMEAIRDSGGVLEDLDIRDSDGSTRNVEIDVRVPDPEELGQVARELCELPEVSRCTVRGANGHRVRAARAG
jgi:putative Mg2+ transporter-C (MgtC) family protein